MATKSGSSTARLERSSEALSLHLIGVVTCVYVNPETEQFWMIDFRVYDPEGDEQSKIEHMLEMLDNVLHSKKLSFTTVLIDSWHASMQVIKRIEALEKLYYCPIKTNRHVDNSEGAEKHKRVDKLTWSDQEQAQGKTVHLKKMPKGHRVKLFRLAFSNERTDYVITNDMTQDDSGAVKTHCGVRWKKRPQQGVSCRYRRAGSMTRCYLLLQAPFEQFHREAKQVTGLERCQCRTTRALRNHIACSFLVWAQLKRLATQPNTTVYQLKSQQLGDYVRQQLKHPSIPMTLCA